MRSVISDAHVAGNDEISCDSVACGRWNSLQEDLFHKIKGSPWGCSFLFVTDRPKAQETRPLPKGEKRRKKGPFCLFR